MVRSCVLIGIEFHLSSGDWLGGIKFQVLELFGIGDQVNLVLVIQEYLGCEAHDVDDLCGCV